MIELAATLFVLWVALEAILGLIAAIFDWLS
jgi:hypothetical protein